MNNKYPYIATNGLNNFLVYAENTATIIGDENNCFSSGFKMTLCEDGLTDITREYLANTYGKAESKEHAKFIANIAKSVGYEINKKHKSGEFFYISRIHYGFSDEMFCAHVAKLITIPLPPKDEAKKEPESKGWPQVGDDVLICDKTNLDYLSSFAGEKCKVISVCKYDGAKVLTLHNRKLGFAAVNMGYWIKKPKTPEQELRDELIEAMDDSVTAFAYAEYMAKYLLSNYELTKKPQ